MMIKVHSFLLSLVNKFNPYSWTALVILVSARNYW